jgi:hypothetical protein
VTGNIKVWEEWKNRRVASPLSRLPVAVGISSQEP